MNRTPRALVASALGALLATGLAACGDETGSNEGGDALSQVELIYGSALTVCTDSPYEPFAYVENGQPTGFDVDLARALADDLDVQLDVITTPFDDIVSGEALNTDQCDLAVSAISITGERSRVIDFTSPYFDAQQALVVPANSQAKTFQSLAGKKVAVQARTTGESYVRDNVPQAQVVALPDAAQVIDALSKGDVDAAVFDSPAAAELVKGATGLVLGEQVSTGEQYGMAVKKDGNLPLLRRVNSVLGDLREDGTYDEIYAEYFG